MEVNFPSSREAFRRHSGRHVHHSTDEGSNHEPVYVDIDDEINDTDDSGGFLGWPSKISNAGSEDALQDIGKNKGNEPEAAVDPWLERKLSGPQYYASGGADDFRRKSVNSATFQSEGSLSGYSPGLSERGSRGGGGVDPGDLDDDDGEGQDEASAAAKVAFQQQRRESMGTTGGSKSRKSMLSRDTGDSAFPEEEDSLEDEIFRRHASSENLTLIDVPMIRYDDDDADDAPARSSSLGTEVVAPAAAGRAGAEPRRPPDRTGGSVEGPGAPREPQGSPQGGRPSQSSPPEIVGSEEEKEKKGSKLVGTTDEEEEEGKDATPGPIPSRRDSMSAARRNKHLLKSLSATLSKQAKLMASMEQAKGEDGGQEPNNPKSKEVYVLGWGDDADDDSTSTNSRNKTSRPALNSVQGSSGNQVHVGYPSSSAGWVPSTMASSDLKASLDGSSKNSLASSLKNSQLDYHVPRTGEVYEDFGSRRRLRHQSSMTSSHASVEEHNRNNLRLFMMEEEYDPKKPWRKAPLGVDPGNANGKPNPYGQQKNRPGANCGNMTGERQARRDSRMTFRSSFTSDMEFGELLQERLAAHPTATSALDDSSVQQKGEESNALLSPMTEVEGRTTAGGSSSPRARRQTVSDDEDTFLGTQISGVTSALSEGDTSELTVLRQAQEVLFPVPESVSTRDGESTDASVQSGGEGRKGRSDLPLTSLAPTRLSALDIVQEDLPYHSKGSPSSRQQKMLHPAKEDSDGDGTLKNSLQMDASHDRLDDLPISSFTKAKGGSKDDDSVSYSDIDVVEHCEGKGGTMMVRDSMIEREFATETMQDVEYGENKPEAEMTLGMLLDPEGNADGALYGNHNRAGDCDSVDNSKKGSSRKGSSFIKKAVESQTKKLDTKATKGLRRVKRKNKRLWKFCVWNCRKITIFLILGMCVLAGISTISWWGAEELTGNGDDGSDDGNVQTAAVDNDESIVQTGPPEEQTEQPSMNSNISASSHPSFSPPSSSPSPPVASLSNTSFSKLPPINSTHTVNSSSLSQSNASTLAAPALSNASSSYPSFSPPSNSSSPAVPTFSNTSFREPPSTNLTSAAWNSSSLSPSNASSLAAPTLSKPLMNSTSAASTSSQPSSQPSLEPSNQDSFSSSLPSTPPASSNTSFIESLLVNFTSAPASPYPSAPGKNNTLSTEPSTMNSTSASFQGSSSSHLSNSSFPVSTSNTTSFIEAPFVNSTNATSLYPAASFEPTAINSSFTVSSLTNSTNATISSIAASIAPSMNTSVNDIAMNLDSTSLQGPSSSKLSNTSFPVPTSNTTFIEAQFVNSTNATSLYPAASSDVISTNTSFTVSSLTNSTNATILSNTASIAPSMNSSLNGIVIPNDIVGVVRKRVRGHKRGRSPAAREDEAGIGA